MSYKDNDYYRNNTVDLDPKEVKDAIEVNKGQVIDSDPVHHADTPVVVKDQRLIRSHISPTVPKIVESESERSYNSGVHGYHGGQTPRREFGQHLYSEQGQGPTLSNVEEDGYIKHGRLSSPPLSPRQRDLAYQSSKEGDTNRSSTQTKHTRDTYLRDESERVVYLMKSRSPRKSVKSPDSPETIGNSKRSTLEDELKSLSTTPRFSHEDLGRIVSPPDTESVYSKIDTNKISNVDDDMKSILMDADNVKRDLVGQENKRKDLQNRLWDIEEDVKDLNVKLATLRVKLGVANANTNVSKTDCEELRKKFQETQIQMARLEERSKSCNTELERLKDPNNPDSNVNMKKIVVNDRKEIRRLRNELEGIRSERSETRKQMDEQDEQIANLRFTLESVQDQLAISKTEYGEAKIRSEFEEKEREELETKCNALLKEKEEFESQCAKLNSQLESTISGTSNIQKISEQYKTREQALLSKIATADKKLRDVLTEIEQQKNRNMPQRTASSIKYHQYRMSKTSGLVTDTTPQVVVTSDPRGSIAASGYLGKLVVSQKLASSLPSKNSTTKITGRGKPGSLPSKR